MPRAPSSKMHERETWAAGDLGRGAHGTVLAAELLCEAVELHAGERVLDVGTGTGNTALAAARRRTKVVGVDLLASLLERARARVESEGLTAEFREGNAESLPCESASFDVALSTFGVMFAPDQARAAHELVRVVRPGGRLGLASWTPDGYTGRQFAVLDRYAPEPGDAPAPTRWGSEEGLRELFPGARASIHARRRTVNLRGDSAESLVAFQRRFFGPVVRAFEALEPDRQRRLESELLSLTREWNRSGDATAFVPTEYLEAVVRLP
jgi:SAM-dependent methyltransferase